MSSDSALQFSQFLITALGTRMFLYYQNRIPQDSAVVVVSNHRSFMDAPLLMAAIQRPIRFACHHYMANVPLLRDIVQQLGAFPLEAPGQRQQDFFAQGIRMLQRRQAVGVFPEGASPMVRVTPTNKIGKFHRGFAHLAIKAPVQNLAVLPIAIASQEELTNSVIPLRLLRLFDPSEPYFDKPGWHPLIVYRRASILIGRPCWITSSQREQYQGKQAKTVVSDLSGYCQDEISNLLHQGCY